MAYKAPGPPGDRRSPLKCGVVTAAAGLQTPKVTGTGQSSPRKQGLMGGDGVLDGGAFERLQGGIRRTKRC